jgi:hypothetical protein
MTKPETLKDIIDETMRASGVPYKVPADAITTLAWSRSRYKTARCGIEPWDVVQTLA